MIFVIDDDPLMAACLKRALKNEEVRVFGDALSAVSSLDDGELPRLIFLDVLLPGPDGFTFLNELASYADTSEIPVVLVTSLDLADADFSAYHVVGILQKETMTPEDIAAYAKKF